jgi:uncharacterized protein
MKVLLTGSTGLVGSALRPVLTKAGHSVVCLLRPESKLPRAVNGQMTWDPKANRLNVTELEGFDAVIHLAGDSLASSRWTEAKKRQLQESRIASTTLLSEALAGLIKKPEVFIAASAIGYYGNRGEEELDEESSKGTGFLSDLCANWEKATTKAKEAGIRVVNLRFGVVLSVLGGALSKMLLPFTLGVGGQLGAGKQFFSWVSIDDAVGAIVYALQTRSLSGPVNVTAPKPVTNLEFTKILGKVLSRPTIMPVPSVALRLLFGEMADECLLTGQKVKPAKLVASGYHFSDSELEPALRRALDK